VGTVVQLVGPKAVGKSWVADRLEEALGVHHVDADDLVLALVDQGEQPDDGEGWLRWVESAVREALEDHEVVSVEATGAWESDYQLVQLLEDAGHRVVRVWVIAPEEEAMARLKARATGRVAVSNGEARRIYAAASARAEREEWDATIETAGTPVPERPARLLGPLL
jgi:dephospho-CoA kinase